MYNASGGDEHRGEGGGMSYSIVNVEELEP